MRFGVNYNQKEQVAKTFRGGLVTIHFNEKTLLVSYIEENMIGEVGDRSSVG